MQKRFIIWLFLILQMTCLAFIGMSITIAIVSMVDVDRKNEKATIQTSEAVCPNSTSFVSNLFGNTQKSLPHTSQTRFAWSRTEQNTVLSGLFWFAYLSHLVGSVLAQKYGPRKVIGISQMVSSLLSSTIPIFAPYGALTVAWIRAAQGFLSMITFPSAFTTLVGNWSPPHERARFELTSLIGCTLGYSLVDLGFGYISEYIDWKYVFYLTTLYGVVVNVLWFVFIYDTPEKHPTISSKEKQYIEDSLAESAADEAPIPWKKILTSKPAILCIISYAAGSWLSLMPLFYLPIFFKTIYGLNANEIGILTSIWRQVGGIVGVCGGYLADVAVKKKLSSVTNTRKSCAFIGCILSSVPLIVAVYLGCSMNTVIICMTLYSIFQAQNAFASPLAVIDLSPRYCGILVGMAAFIAFLQYFLFSLLINYFTSVWDIEELWKNVFSFTALYAIVANGMFVIFGTCEVQRWNFPKDAKS